jgi:hypothetical protein
LFLEIVFISSFLKIVTSGREKEPFDSCVSWFQKYIVAKDFLWFRLGKYHFRLANCLYSLHDNWRNGSRVCVVYTWQSSVVISKTNILLSFMLYILWLKRYFDIMDFSVRGYNSLKSVRYVTVRFVILNDWLIHDVKYLYEMSRTFPVERFRKSDRKKL